MSQSNIAPSGSREQESEAAESELRELEASLSLPDEWRDRLQQHLQRMESVENEDLAFLEAVICDQPRPRPKLQSHLIRCVVVCIVATSMIVGALAAFRFGSPLTAELTTLLNVLLLAGASLLLVGMASFFGPILELFVMQRVFKLKQAADTEELDELRFVKDAVLKNYDPAAGKVEIAIGDDPRWDSVLPKEVATRK